MILSRDRLFGQITAFLTELEKNFRIGVAGYFLQQLSDAKNSGTFHYRC